MGNTIKVLEGQSILDICLIHSGSLSSLFDIMKANGLTDLTIAPGTELFIPDVINQKVVDYLIQNNLASLPVEYNTGGGSVPSATVVVKNSIGFTLRTVNASAGSSVEEIINDSVLIIGGAEFEIPAETGLILNLKDQNGSTITPTVSGNDIIVDMAESVDITVNSSPFKTLPPDTDYNIVLKDQHGNVITPTSLSEPVITVNTEADWIRPSDWLNIDSLVNVGDHKFVGLMAVFPDKPSFWHFNFGQAYTVRIDGVATNYAAGAQATGSISFTSLNPSTTTSEGFRQAIIEVFPQVAPANTAFTLTSTRTSAPTNFIPNFIDIRLSFPNITSMFMNGGTRFAQLRRWTWLGSVPAISRSLAFNSPYLREVNENLSTANGLTTYFSATRLPAIIGNITNNVVTSLNNFISGWGNRTIGNISSTSAINCTTLILSSNNTETIGDLNLPAATSFTLLGLPNLKKLGTINIPLVSSLSGALQLANVETIGTVTTGTALTNIASVINGNRLLKSFRLSNCENVTTTTTAFSICTSLQELILGGLKVGFTVPPCQMDDAAFAALFNSLGTATGSQSIVITGNITLSPATIAIATGKGFTIVP